MPVQNNISSSLQNALLTSEKGKFAASNNQPPPNDDKLEIIRLDGVQNRPQTATAFLAQTQSLNTDLLEITPLSNEQMQNYISESNNLSNKYSQYIGGTRNIDDVLSFYKQGRADIIKTYGDANENDNAFLNAHLNALDKAFESQMKHIGEAVAGDLAYERYTREQEAIYIPKYINQLEQWYKDALKNGNQKSIGILSAEIDRMNARVGNSDTNKLAMHSDFDEVEFKTNMANQMGEYARQIAQNFKSGVDSVSAQKTAFELMMSVFNKTTSINNLSFSDFMVVYKHSDYVAFVTDKPTPITEAMRNENNNAFNNSKELSAELKAFLK